MRSYRFAPLAIVIAAFAGTVYAQSAGPAVLTPGLWQVTTQMKSPTIAAPVSHTICIDKAHVGLPAVPKLKPTADCQVHLDSAASNQVNFTIACSKQNVTAAYKFTYAADHYDGTVSITSADGVIQQTVTAVRLGVCDDLPDLSGVPNPPFNPPVVTTPPSAPKP